MLLKAIALLTFGLIAAPLISAQPPAPKLFLNTQRLRRLKRDHERNTVRWVNFETRINTVADSPERGFELALFYAVTGDEAKGREAIDWTLHHNSARQSALVADWCAPLLNDTQKAQLLAAPQPTTEPHFTELRDATLLRIAQQGTADPLPDAALIEKQLASLRESSFSQPEQLYALFELIYAVRSVSRQDLRETDIPFFAHLPEALLLAPKPGQLNSPPWLTHAAALVLVALDPNLPGSQFLQSWAVEDSQTVREGPGVAYELLWADPYLPGVGYQNMEPFIYDDEHSRLFARSGWEPNACWIAITPKGIDEQNCPLRWKMESTLFGHLTLIPLLEHCVEIPHLTNHNETVLVWHLKPHDHLIFGKGKDQRATSADAAGLWHPGANIEGRVCLAPR